MTEYDYVVVGAGSAGAIIASRLAGEGDASVILLEAGGSDRSRFCDIPGMVSIIHTIPQVKKKFDWGYYTVPQKHALGRRIPTTRGKVLGGSSSINGMIFVRGNSKNYDAWAADGCPGWSFRDVLPFFKKLEDWEDGESELRGAGGPVAVTRQRDLTPVSEAFVSAVSETCGIPRIADYNGPSQEGVFAYQMSAKDGQRYSTSRAFLRDRVLDNLTTRTGALVGRVVIEAGRAVGVELVSGREREVVRARREVILSAGVFGSPQILMLSGVGPADHLSRHGIDVVADLPVGNNLQDHLFVPMTFLAPEARHRGTALYFFGGMLAEALRGQTWFGRTVFEGGAFLQAHGAKNGVPNMQIHALPWAYPSPNQDAPVRPVVDQRPALTVMPTLIYPESRGKVRLACADPSAAPLIDPAYLSAAEDSRFLIEGMKLTREIMASRLLERFVTGELHPGDAAKDDAGLRRELPNRIHTVYHPVGTCRMGSDERAVVDPSLKVRGVDALRIADASVMPCITGGNTNAPTMMIGERCVELLLARA